MVKFTTDEKIHIVLRYLNGNESYREIGKAIGIRDTVILNWVNQYKQKGVVAFVSLVVPYYLCVSHILLYVPPTFCYIRSARNQRFYS